MCCNWQVGASQPCHVMPRLLTLGTQAQLGLQLKTQWKMSLLLCVCVCHSVCLKLHLSSGASVRPENAATNSVSNDGQGIVEFPLKLLHCRATALPPFYGYSAVSHFITVKYIHVLLGFHIDLGAGSGN